MFALETSVYRKKHRNHGANLSTLSAKCPLHFSMLCRSTPLAPAEYFDGLYATHSRQAGVGPGVGVGVGVDIKTPTPESKSTPMKTLSTPQPWLQAHLICRVSKCDWSVNVPTLSTCANKTEAHES